VLTPIMTFWVLPFVTKLIRPWLLAPPRSRSARRTPSLDSRP
jgi:hypothetical protein